MKFTTKTNRLNPIVPAPSPKELMVTKQTDEKELIFTKQTDEKESMKKLNRQSYNSSPQEGSNNPQLELRQIIAPITRLTGTITSKIGLLFSLAQGLLAHAKSIAESTARWFSRPQRLRHLLVWLLVFIIFAQPNIAVAQALSASTPYEHARQAALAASLPASSPSWFAKLTQQIPDLTPVVSSVVATAKTAFFLVFPFEDSEAENLNTNQSAAIASARLAPTSHNQALAGTSKQTAFAGNQFSTDSTFSPFHLFTSSSFAGKQFSSDLFPTTVSYLTAAPVFQSATQVTDAAITLQVPTFNNGRIEGNLRIFEGRSFNINGGFQLTQDMFIVGTPTLRLNGNASHGGIVDEGGSTTPSNYTITLNGGVNLPGKIHIHANAIPLPTDIPTSVPQPTGTRDVNINNAGDANNIGNWATVRDLNVNVNNLTINVPPGNYRQFTLNGQSRLEFANGAYNFSNTINLNGGSSIQSTGAVTINIAQSMNINGASTLVSANTSVSNVKLNVLGTTLNLNGNTNVTGFVRAPNAAVTIQGNSRVRGQVIAKELRLNGGGEIIGDSTPPTASITTPANGFSTTQAAISVSGTATDAGSGTTGIARVSVNNAPAVYNAATGTWSIANVALNIGTNTITARAEDLFGNISATQITVTRLAVQQDTTAPQLVIATPSNNSTTQAESVTVSGTVSDPPPNASGVASVTVNNVNATRDVAAGTWTLANVALLMGANTLTVRATDVAGNVSTQTINVTRVAVPPPDTTPPTLAITAPANNAVTGDVSISISGTAVDSGANASGILKVSVNGVDATFDAGNNTWTATGIGLQNGNNRIVAQAEDRAHNLSSAEINVRKANAPTLTITNPQAGAIISSSSLTVAGTVATDSPGVSVNVTVNGQAASIAGGQFTKTIALTNGTNTVTIIATDSLNQTSQSSITVINDQTAPTVELTGVPTSVQAGGNYTIVASATDETGLLGVDFAVDGQPFVTDMAAPFQFTLAVPANAAANQVIVITATARDSAGLTGTATARTRVTGPGGVSGYVFDDATGYGIAEVTANFSDGSLTSSDVAGGFIYVSSAPVGLARMVKAGYTVVERAYTFADGGGSSLFDARLTTLGSTANPIGAQGGTANGDNARVSVVFGAGAFADGSDVRLTSVSPQGLINLLPFGWSPVPGAVIDIRRSDPTLALPNVFPSVARLTLNETSGLAAGTKLTLARYDENTHNWIVVIANLTAGANGALQADILTAGQYAFLVADTGVTAPPGAVAGQPLPSGAAADSALLESATAFATSSPRSAVVSAQARSTIAFFANAAQKLPSGVAIEASFGETYNLLSQTNPLLVDRPSQDFVLYSYPAATETEPNRLGAFFIAKPTRFELTLTQLRSANVHITIRSGRPLTSGTLIGTGGGQVTTADGATSLEIAAGALPSATPVFIEALPPAAVDLTLPTGYEIVGAVEVDLSTAVLATGGTLSVPTVTGDLSRIVVARVISAGGRRAPKVVARATEVSGKLRSTTATPTVPSGITLSGINVGGLYVFMRVPAAFGYLTGTVSASGSPAAMVRVTVNQTPFVDVTGANGRFVVVGAVGANNLEAASIVTDATGVGAATLASQNAIAETAIAIASVALAVQSVTPANNAANIIVTTPITLSFSKPVNPATLTGSTLRVTTATGNPVLGSITLLAGNRVAVFTPQSNLAGSTAYKVSVTTAVQDLYGTALSAAFESGFSTAAVVTADNRLKPEKVQINYPNAQGFVTVTIPAGAVPEGSTIVLINNASGATVTTVAGSAAISLQIQAQVGDEITVLVRQPDGTEYRINQAAYKKEDGTTTVGRNGGAVTSTDGATVLSIPKNAISGQVDLKLTPKAEAAITIPRQNEMDAANMTFGAGVEISAQGNFTVEKELHLELPAPANAVEGQRAAFLKPSKVMENNQEVDVWEVVTSGRVEGGKLKTNSPPFSGLIFLDGIFSVYSFMPVRQKVVLGTVKEPTSQTDSTLIGVPNVLCVLGSSVLTGLANHLTARTNRAGYYAIFDVSTQPSDASFVHAIDDTNGRRKSGSPTYISTIESQFLQGLQGFQVSRIDLTLDARSGSSGESAPLLTLFPRVIPEVSPDPLVTLGVVQAPSQIVIKAFTDRTVQEIKGRVTIGGSADTPLEWTLLQTIPPNGDQRYEAAFNAATEGSYSILVTVRKIASDPTTETRATYNFIALRNPNTRPPLEGAPSVIMSTPANAATNVDVATDIRLEFSEPVTNLYAGNSLPRTVYIEEMNSHEIIGGTITSGAVIVDATTPDISSIVLRPDRALDAGKQYCLRVTTEVKDSNNIPFDQQPNTSGNQPFQACFTTFSGSVLNDAPVVDPGTRIVISGSYAITVTGDNVTRSTLRVYDIANPQTPSRVSELNLPQRALELAVNEEVTLGGKKDKFTRLAAVVTHNPLQAAQSANVWFINLDAAEQPKLVGVTSLYLPEGLPTAPLSVQLKGNKAFIGNSPLRGVIEVDIAKSIEEFEKFDNPDIPTLQAIAPGQGFARETKTQSVRYADLLTQASAASSIAVLDQQVIRPLEPFGAMRVVYATNTVAKKLMVLGFAAQFNGNNGFFDPDENGTENRIIASPTVNPQDNTPARVRAVAEVLTNNGRKDLALVLGGNRIWIFNVTNPVSPEQYPSRTFAEMGLTGDTGSGSYFDIEGTLAYVAMGSRVAVIDFFNPENPRVIAVINGVGSNLAALAVKDGFIFTLSPGSGELDGLNVSIARPASRVFVHGYNANGIEADLLCANPIVISRSSLGMQQDAEIFFMLFGQITASAAQIKIKKNNEVIDTVAAEILSASAKVIRGKARWRTSAVIDRAAKYTAEVVLNASVTGEVRLKPEPIPFSFLISEYSPAIGVEIKDKVVSKEEDRWSYSYLLGSTARVNISVNGVNKLADKTRNVGLHVEAPGFSDSFAPESFLTGLATGKHRLILSATMLSNPAYTEQVETTVTVARNLEGVRPPGHIVVSGVDLFTGNLGLTYTDVAEIPNRGLSLSLTRSYNSLSADAFSPFGYGWHHNYQVLLTRRVLDREQNTAELTIRGGDGEGMRFEEGAVDVEMFAKAPHQGKLVKRNDGSYDFYTKARIRYHFPGALNFDSTVLFDHGYMGNLDYIEEPHGIKLQLFYKDGKLERVTDSSSRSLNFSYERAISPFAGFLGTSFNSAQNRACVRKEEFAFAANKLLKADIGLAWRINKVTGPGGIEINYEYDTDGNLSKVTRKGTDAISEATSNAVWEYGYSPTVPAGSSLDVTHVLKSVKNPNGNTTTYSYNVAFGLVVERINYPEAANNEFIYRFDNGTVTGVDVLDGKGFKTTYTLTRETVGGYTIEMQTPITIGTGDLAVTTTRFTSIGLKFYERDAEGLITEISYDLNGNPATMTRSGGNSNEGQLKTIYEFDPLYSKPTSIKDPRGNVTEYRYNGQGDVISVRLPTTTNNPTILSYGSNGDLLSVTDERGLVTRYENFDQFGNPQTIRRQTESNNEVVANNSFDMRSRLKTSSSTLGPIVSNTYDALDRVKFADTNDPSSIRDSFTTTYAYKPGGQVASLSVTGGGQNYQAGYSYDGLERLMGATETGNGIGSLTRAYTYDRNSNVESETDRRGVTTTYRYNELNYPIEMKITGGHSPASEANVITIAPDKVGNPKSRTDIYGNTITYGYDVFHRLTSRTYPGNLSETLKLDANGNVIEFTDRNGRTTTTTYDSLNRPSQVADALQRKVTYTYDDAVGTVNMEQQPQGLTVEATTDALNRPLRQKVKFAATEYVTSYSYNGRSVQITDPRGTVVTKTLSAMGEVGDTSLTLENGAQLKTEMRYGAFGGVKSFKDANNRTTSFVVDGLGRTTAASYPTPPQVSESFQYDGEGLLVSHTDRRGVVSTMSYDNLRRELESVMGGIRVMKHDYNNASRTETKTDANNHATVCVYDGLMRLVSLTNADGKVKSYEYDGENLIRESDFKGKKSEYKYDVINRLIEVKDRSGAQVTTISHSDAGGHRSDTTDRRGNHRLEVYDPLQRLMSVTDGGQPLANYEYDGNSNRVAMTDGRSNRSVYEYDRANRVKQINHAGSLQTEAFSYDGVGNALSYNDGFGANVTMSYDALDHPLTRTDGAGNVTRYKYDGEGLLVERVEPKGAVGAGFKTSYDYNGLRSLKEVRDPRGGVWTYGYDAAQNLTGMTDALNRLTSYEYDTLNRLTKVTQPQSLVTQYEYDNNSNRTAVIDAKGQRTALVYDELDRAQQANYLAAGGGAPSQGPRQHQFGYDPEGNLTSVQESTASNGTATTRNYSRTYDARDRLVTATDANNRVVSYGYDATNNVTSVTDAASKQTSYSYDALNRLSSVQMSGGRTATYSWKADGLLANVQLPSGMSRSYSYDNADRLTSIINSLGGGASEEFAYSYDGNSNRESESRKRDGSSYRQLSYQYDELDRLTSVGYGGSSSQGLKGEYFNNRDFSSRALTRTDATVDFTWTGSQTPSPSVQDDTFSVRWTGKVEAQFSESYTFYAESDEAVKVWVNGQLVIDDATDHTTREASGSIQLQANQKHDLKIEYSENTGDAAIKLSWSSASQPKQVIPQSRLFVPDATNYSYDAVGNRLSESGVDFAGAPINRGYSYDALNRLQSVTGDAAGAIAFQYDNNGNLSSQTQGSQTTRYEYDTRDQMRRVLEGATGNSEIASFDYDFSRRRLSKTASGISTSFVYDGSNVINEYGASNQLVNRYDYGADLIRGELGGEGERFYFSDALGSTTALSSIIGSSGVVSSRFEYDAWGVLSASSSASTNPIGYTGQRLDSETGLMALGNGERYYAPQFGQFMQQDSFTGSLTMPQSLNRHSYVNGNPLRFTDPTGHEAQQHGYIQQTFNNTIDRLAKRSDDSWLAFYAQYMVRQGESAYQLVDGILGGYIHRQDRLIRNYANGNISGGQLVGGTMLNNLVSAPIAGANIALMVGTGGAAGLAYAGGRGAMAGFLAKMGLAGGVIGGANLLAEDSFNKAIYGEEFHTRGEYAEAIGEGAALGVLFGLLELGGARIGSSKPKPGATPEVQVEGRTQPSSRTVPATERAVPGAARADGPEFQIKQKDLFGENADRFYADEARSVADDVTKTATEEGIVPRQRIIEKLDEVVQKRLDEIKALDPNAEVGIRGSLARGSKGSHKGNAPFDPNNFDIDIFVSSNELRRGRGFQVGPKPLRVIAREIDKVLRQLPEFIGLRGGKDKLQFRVFGKDEISNLADQGDAQIFFPREK